MATTRPDQRRLRRILVGVSLAMFLVDLDFFALNLAVPSMARDLRATTTDMQWVISGYMLTGGALLIPGGRLGDILGRRRMLLTGIAIFGLSSLACGLAPTKDVVFAFRVVQGMGAALLFPLTIAVITNAFPPERRGAAIGDVYGLAAIGTAVGPFVGGAISQHLGWRWVFLFNIPFAALALALVAGAVGESRDETAPRRIDFPGLAAVAGGIAAITFAVDRGQAWGLSSPRTLGLFAAGMALLAGFVAIERRVRFPLVDLSLFRNRPYVAVTLAGMVANVAFCVTTFASTLYLQEVRGLSPLLAGVVFLAPALCLASAGPLSGYLGARLPALGVMAMAIAAGGVGLLLVASARSWLLYVPAFALFGAGYGLGWSFVSVGTQAVVQPQRAGEASGVTLTVVVAVAGLCVAVSATVLELLAGPHRSQGTAIDDLLRALALGTLVIAASLALYGRRRRAGTAGVTAST
ncbi:MAG: MFS transporter [Solirubrobacteraceae bacterium]